MKKLVNVVLALMLLCTLTTWTTQAQSKEINLAFVIPGTNSQYWNQYCGTGCINAVQDIEKKYGISVNASMYGDAEEGNTEAYLGIMESVIATAPDCIITATMEENGTVQVVKDAYAQGIYLNFFSLGIVEGVAEDCYGALYYCDQPEQGVVAGNFVGERLIEKYGTDTDWSKYYVGMHLATSTPVLEQKMEMFRQTISQVCPKINVTDTLYNENDVNQAQSNVENQLSTYGDKLIALFGGNNISGDGVVLACKNAGRKDIISCAVDSDEIEIEGLRGGWLTAIICQTPYDQAYHATYDALEAICTGVDLDTFNQGENSYNYPCSPCPADRMDETEFAALLDPTILAYSDRWFSN
jgi:ribose transport system substrate-binding protein